MNAGMKVKDWNRWLKEREYIERLAQIIRPKFDQVTLFPEARRETSSHKFVEDVRLARGEQLAFAIHQYTVDRDRIG